MDFEKTLKEIIETHFLLQDKNTPYLNEKTVQLKIAIELYKKMGIEVELEKCFNPFDNNSDYLDIFYKEKKIGIELKYKLKRFKGFPFKNQGAQNQGAHEFFIDIHRLENWVLLEKNLDTGFAILITNDNIYKQERRGKVKDFSLTNNHKICKNKEYPTFKETISFEQDYPNFSWVEKESNINSKCKFFACILKVEEPKLKVEKTKI